MTFSEDLAAAKAAPKDTREVSVVVNGKLATLRFEPLLGDAWAEITGRCPVRLDAPIDRNYGYNMHAVCKLAAPLSGALVGEDTLTDEDWADLFAVLSGHELTLIIDAVYDLNEYSPAQRIGTIKKEYAALTASETTSD